MPAGHDVLPHPGDRRPAAAAAGAAGARPAEGGAKGARAGGLPQPSPPPPPLSMKKLPGASGEAQYALLMTRGLIAQSCATTTESFGKSGGGGCRRERINVY